MSYQQVEAAVPESVNIVSDPPRELTMELARQQVERGGHRAVRRLRELQAWVRQGLDELQGD
jgi:hypothetical protein